MRVLGAWAFRYARADFTCFMLKWVLIVQRQSYIDHELHEPYHNTNVEEWITCIVEGTLKQCDSIKQVTHNIHCSISSICRSLPVASSEPMLYNRPTHTHFIQTFLAASTQPKKPETSFNTGPCQIADC
jgi:hypothetical protein